MTEYSIEQCHSLISKYPECYPVILTGDANLVKTKLLINKDMTVSQLMSYIRIHNKLSKREAYFLFTESKLLLMQSSVISEIYSTNAAVNGFLYINVKKENTFG